VKKFSPFSPSRLRTWLTTLRHVVDHPKEGEGSALGGAPLALG
jgi:hypothetical protein